LVRALRERTCIVTRQVKPESALIRFVRAPDGAVTPDLRARLPGRGVWVTADRSHVATAARKGMLVKMLGSTAKVAPQLADQVDGLLMMAAVGALAMARKAGSLVGGFTKVEDALRSGKAVAVIHADDAAQDGQSKLAGVARKWRREGLPVLRCFAREQLDLAFGRTNVIHAALLASQASDNALKRVGDLLRYRNSGENGGSRDPGNGNGLGGNVFLEQ
jgi:predicted RNA-binding protein YlxR (DUF448 family)